MPERNEEERYREAMEALEALRARLNDSGSEPGTWVSTVVDNNGELTDLETSGFPDTSGEFTGTYDNDAALFRSVDSEIRRLYSEATAEARPDRIMRPYSLNAEPDQLTYDEAYDETVNPDNFDYERAEEAVLNAYSDITPELPPLTVQQREILEALTRDNLTATGREAHDTVTGGTRRRAESDSNRFAPGGLVSFGSPGDHPVDSVPFYTTGTARNYNFTYGQNWATGFQNLSWQITHHETEGDIMPSTAVPAPLAERLSGELRERQQEMTRTITSAIRATETTLSQLREALDYVGNFGERLATVSELEEAKYLIRSSRDYTASTARTVNPAPAAFTNMIRLSRNLTEERARIETERQEARAEERQEIFREAVAASEDYVPAVGDYLQVTSLSRWPLEVREIYPDVEVPTNIGSASVLMHTQSGPIGTRSVAWLRRAGMEQVSRDTPPVPVVDTRYVPAVGDTIVLPRGMSGRNGTTEIIEFRVEHVTQNTSVFSDDGCPNPEVRLEAVARPGAFWTRRLSRLRDLGMRPAFPGTGTAASIPSADYILQVGDRFTLPDASLIDLELRPDTVFTVREVDTLSQFQTDGVEIWFSAEGRSYRYLRSMNDLRAYGYALATPAEVRAPDWCPMVGDRVTFNGRESLTYVIDNVAWTGDNINPEIRFHAMTDGREEPYFYTYRLEHLHGLDMRLANE